MSFTSSTSDCASYPFRSGIHAFAGLVPKPTGRVAGLGERRNRTQAGGGRVIYSEVMGGLWRRSGSKTSLREKAS
jgi:hypothetical protein